MEEYDFKRDEVRSNILTNRHNHITTCYYLLLKKKIKKGIPSISDLVSEEYKNFTNDKKNFMSSYNNDINLVVLERSVSAKRKQIILLDSSNENSRIEKSSNIFYKLKFIININKNFFIKNNFKK